MRGLRWGGQAGRGRGGSLWRRENYQVITTPRQLWRVSPGGLLTPVCPAQSRPAAALGLSAPRAPPVTPPLTTPRQVLIPFLLVLSSLPALCLPGPAPGAARGRRASHASSTKGDALLSQARLLPAERRQGPQQACFSFQEVSKHSVSTYYVLGSVLDVRVDSRSSQKMGPTGCRVATRTGGPSGGRTCQEKLRMGLWVLAQHLRGLNESFLLPGSPGQGQEGDTVNMCRPGNRSGVRDTLLLLGGQTTTEKG